MDLAIPIVFPDYLISVNTREMEVDILPWVDFDNFTIPSSQNRLPELGHAGILFINGDTGTTKYYEYGRYDRANLGIVRRVPIPDVRMDYHRPTNNSLKNTLRRISAASGQGGRISAAYIEVEGAYGAMLSYARLRKAQNTDDDREPYELLSNSCLHFVTGVLRAAGVSLPWMIDPRPNSYINEIRDDFLDLNYNPTGNKLLIEGTDT